MQSLIFQVSKRLPRRLSIAVSALMGWPIVYRVEFIGPGKVNAPKYTKVVNCKFVEASIRFTLTDEKWEG